MRVASRVLSLLVVSGVLTRSSFVHGWQEAQGSETVRCCDNDGVTVESQVLSWVGMWATDEERPAMEPDHDRQRRVSAR